VTARIPESESVAREIQERLDSAIEALKREDARGAVQGLFAPDAIYVRSGATLVGAQAIEAMFAAAPRIAEGWIRTTSLVVHGDLAYEVGTNSITRHTADGSTLISRGRYLSVWRRQPDGSWRIVADAPIADPP